MTTDSIVEKKNETTIQPPRMYKVIFINDDYTPMDFVVDVLVRMFGHTEESAVQIMYAVHETGKGVAGVYTKDIAETKAALVTAVAKVAEHPLLVVVEEE